MHRGVDLADPGVKWKSFVSSEREGLTCGRGVVVYVRCDDEEHDKDHQGIDARGGEGLLEDVDEGDCK